MDTQTINERIEKLEKVKSELLKLKKDQRNNELKQVNGMIVRLKNWRKDIAKNQKQAKTVKNETERGLSVKAVRSKI